MGTEVRLDRYGAPRRLARTSRRACALIPATTAATHNGPSCSLQPPARRDHAGCRVDPNAPGLAKTTQSTRPAGPARAPRPCNARGHPQPLEQVSATAPARQDHASCRLDPNAPGLAKTTQTTRPDGPAPERPSPQHPQPPPTARAGLRDCARSARRLRFCRTTPVAESAAPVTAVAPEDHPAAATRAAHPLQQPGGRIQGVDQFPPRCDPQLAVGGGQMLSTVRTESTSSSAMSLSRIPCAASRAISASRRVSCSGRSTDPAAGVSPRDVRAAAMTAAARAAMVPAIRAEDRAADDRAADDRADDPAGDPAGDPADDLADHRAPSSASSRAWPKRPAAS